MRFRAGYRILSVTNNEADLPNAMVEVFAGPLNVQDAIGNPNEKDYPIQRGKEKLMDGPVKFSSLLTRNCIADCPCGYPLHSG